MLAVIRRDKTQASQLVQNLSTFFRKNLKRTEEIASLKDELEHVNAYLQIEKMRFMEQLTIEFDIPTELEFVQLPAFSLQPIVENAIKHGTSQLIGIGKVIIRAHANSQSIILEVIDNAGNYCENKKDNKGLGLNLVDKRIKIRYGEKYGINIECEPDEYTKVMLTLPLQKDTNVQC